MTQVMHMPPLTSPMDIPNGRRTQTRPSPVIIPTRQQTNGDFSDEESDTFDPDTPRSLLSNPSPRCEAYVMTGEKMLRLNSKISPSYAKAKQDQLPPDTPVLDPVSPRKRGPFDDFPSLHHKTTKCTIRRNIDETGVPNSQSEHILGETPTGTKNHVMSRLHSGPSEDEASSVTVNALCRGASETESTQTLPSPTVAVRQRIECKSEPCSPLRHPAGQHSGSVEDNTLVIRVSPDNSLPSTPLKEKLRQMGEKSTTTLGDKDHDATVRLAKRLYELDGFRKEDVAAHLTRNNEFSSHVAKEYLKLFNFAGLRLDAAIRLFLSKFCLIGESSERERVLSYFSRRYHNCNPAVFDSEDEIHTLTCALLLLNTDLHGQNLRKRMTCHEFINNLSSENTGFTYKRDLLKALYASIKETPIEWAGETSSSSEGGSKEFNIGMQPQEDLESQVEYKKGWVLRKCMMDADGKRTPFGRRGWKMMYGTLKGTVLYLHKDERGFKRSAYHTYQNAIRINHAWAMKTKDYTKRQHVFLLRTATLGEYLFETSEPLEVDSWIDVINFVAASFSAPALPAPISANQTFHRPLLPTHTTKLSMREQMSEHERKVEEMNEMLESIRLDAPSLNAKGRVVQEFFYKERYYQDEKRRYETYVKVLQEKAQADNSIMTDSIGPVSTIEITGDTSINDSRCMTAHSGQSDRLSYREAIDNWAADSSQDSTATTS